MWDETRKSIYFEGHSVQSVVTVHAFLRSPDVFHVQMWTGFGSSSNSHLLLPLVEEGQLWPSFVTCLQRRRFQCYGSASLRKLRVLSDSVQCK